MKKTIKEDGTINVPVKQLEALLGYAHKMSKLVSPKDMWDHYQISDFGGDICDTYGDLEVALHNGEWPDIEKDEFYNPIINKMGRSVDMMWGRKKAW